MALKHLFFQCNMIRKLSTKLKREKIPLPLPISNNQKHLNLYIFKCQWTCFPQHKFGVNKFPVCAILHINISIYNYLWPRYNKTNL